MYFRMTPFFCIHISQGSVATCLKTGGIFKHEFVANLLPSQLVIKFWKSDNSWWNYGQEFGVLFFLTHGVYYIYKSTGNAIWNFVINSGLTKFRHDKSIVKMYHQLSSTKLNAQSAINWTVVGQLSDNTSELWRSTTSLSQWSWSSVYSTIRSHGFISDSWYLFTW